jgi:glutathione peroxidase
LTYGTTFKTFSKIEVNGKNEAPLYTFLKSQVTQESEDDGAKDFLKVLKDLAQTVTGNNIKWNFTKFLVDRDGEVIHRFAPTFKPEDIEPFVEKLL